MAVYKFNIGNSAGPAPTSSEGNGVRPPFAKSALRNARRFHKACRRRPDTTGEEYLLARDEPAQQLQRDKQSLKEFDLQKELAPRASVSMRSHLHQGSQADLMESENESQGTDRQSVALAWGWGGEYRLGTGSDAPVHSPRRVHSTLNRLPEVDLVGVAVGGRHTVFHSSRGLVFAMGDGRDAQLGSAAAHLKPVAIQRLPSRVLPTGMITHLGTDVKVGALAAGLKATFLRERNGLDAANETPGLHVARDGVRLLLRDCPTNCALNELQADIELEYKRLLRRHRGRLLVLGSSDRGQLGLGQSCRQAISPTFVRGILPTGIRCIAAGPHHVVASTLHGEVYTWGSGADGRLGLGDNCDRWEPCLVRGALEGEPVITVAAGHAHSAAVVPPLDVYTWGRGAHGRLGIADSTLRSRKFPTRVKRWPPAYRARALEVKQLALGGAHSLLLAAAQESVIGGSSGTGGASLVVSWGCGLSGQLGVGPACPEHAIQPLLVRFEHYVRSISSIAAGKASSFATDDQGRVMSWGKGWRGQLGVGSAQTDKIRLSPSLVPLRLPEACTVTSVALSAGVEHCAAVAMTGKACRGLLHLEGESHLLLRWRCPRRLPYSGPGVCKEPLFQCGSCNMDSICRVCAQRCHKGHNIHPCTLKFRVLCMCGLQPFAEGKCLLLPPALEDVESPPSAMLKLKGDAAANIQRCIRGWLWGRKPARLLQLDKQRAIKQAVCNAWEKSIVGTVLCDVARRANDAQVALNRSGMLAADREGSFLRYYCKLQCALSSFEAQRGALRWLFARAAITTVSSQSAADPRVQAGATLPSLVTSFSRTALRRQQRRVPQHLRLKEPQERRRTGGSTAPLIAAHPAFHHRGSLQCAGSEYFSHISVSAFDGCPSDPAAYPLIYHPKGGLRLSADIDARTVIAASFGYRSSHTLAAPEQLFHRVSKASDELGLRLASRRTSSCPDLSLLQVDKGISRPDRMASVSLSSYWEGVDASLSATLSLQLQGKRRSKLLTPGYMGSSRGAAMYAKFLRRCSIGAPDYDTMSFARRSRSHSICAPERVGTSMVTWMRRLEDLEPLLVLGKRYGYPTTELLTPTRRAECWIRVMVGTPNVPSLHNLHEAAQTITERAGRCGYITIPYKEEVKPAVDLALTALPEGWEEADDGAGNIYYYSTVTGESQWERPLPPYSGQLR